MVLYSDILITVGGSILGVVLSLLVQSYFSYRKYEKGPDVAGQWYTAYQSAERPTHPWIEEEVIFKFKFTTGKLQFFSYNNQDKEEIEGNADIFGRDYVIGRWRQKDSRAGNHGVFMLIIAPSGRLMYGFWSGITETGEKRNGGWVYGREKRDLDQAKLLLKKVTNDLNA